MVFLGNLSFAAVAIVAMGGTGDIRGGHWEGTLRDPETF